MQWDRFFEDLEVQLDGEWEAERAALDTEAERLRLARLSLRERLLAHVGREAAPITVELAGGTMFTGRLVAVGADWAALTSDAQRARGGIVPLSAVTAVTLGQEDLLRTARGHGGAGSLTDRMSFGFVLRDLVRRRVPVTVQTTADRQLTGTIDRAAADHLDLALHDVSAPRRQDQVSGYRVLPYSAIGMVRPEAPLRLS